MGFAQPDVEMSTFCWAVFSGCSNGHSSGAMIHPGGEKHGLFLCCFPMGDNLVWKADMVLTESVSPYPVTI